MKEGNVLFNDALNTFYLRLYGIRHMVITTQIVREETRCRHMGNSFRLTARVLLYAPSHRQDSTYHGLCYTSCGALAEFDPWSYFTYSHTHTHTHMHACAHRRTHTHMHTCTHTHKYILLYTLSSTSYTSVFSLYEFLHVFKTVKCSLELFRLAFTMSSVLKYI